MNRHVSIALVLGGVALLVGIAGAQAPPQAPADTLQGTLRIHPKFHFRYYLEGFGDGQACALFQADERLQAIKPGTTIRVRGSLASRFFGDPADPMPALIPTWVIYMDVDEIEVVGSKQ
jgi:hypothetical protein